MTDQHDDHAYSAADIQHRVPDRHGTAARRDQTLRLLLAITLVNSAAIVLLGFTLALQAVTR